MYVSRLNPLESLLETYHILNVLDNGEVVVLFVGAELVNEAKSLRLPAVHKSLVELGDGFVGGANHGVLGVLGELYAGVREVLWATDLGGLPQST